MASQLALASASVLNVRKYLPFHLLVQAMSFSGAPQHEPHAVAFGASFALDASSVAAGVGAGVGVCAGVCAWVIDV